MSEIISKMKIGLTVQVHNVENNADLGPQI